MLAVKTYPQEYIDGCRAGLDAQLAAYDAVAAAATDDKVADALGAFAPLFFANLVHVLDGYFMHRTRAIEGKDPNSLNEVRMMCTSLLENGGVLAADRQIRYTPEGSVLGLAVGDAVVVDEPGFRRLADAYFAEIEARFT